MNTRACQILVQNRKNSALDSLARHMLGAVGS